MSIKKYQVFVSSTFSDLTEERQDTINSILDMKHIPAGMELFPASNIDQFEYIKKVIDQCDYYLLIIGGRYGSLDKDGISYTEKEFDYALETKKFIIAFLHEKPETLPFNNSEASPDGRKSLDSFRAKARNGRLVKFWTSRENLALKVLQSLNHAFNDYPQVGWIRGDSAASEQVLEQSNKALLENAELRAKIAKLTKANEPAFSDLADLDDTIELRYRTKFVRSSGTTYRDHVYSLTWRKIFLVLAAELKTSRTDIFIQIAFKQAAKDDGIDHSPHDLHSMDIAKIKMQFVAHGLITTKVSNTTTGDIAEFMTLTDKGRQIYMNSIVIRKSSPILGNV